MKTRWRRLLLGGSSMWRGSRNVSLRERSGEIEREMERVSLARKATKEI